MFEDCFLENKKAGSKEPALRLCLRRDLNPHLHCCKQDFKSYLKCNEKY